MRRPQAEAIVGKVVEHLDAAVEAGAEETYGVSGELVVLVGERARALEMAGGGG